MRLTVLSCALYSVLTVALVSTSALAAETIPVRGAFPAAGAANVCPDTPLRLTFPRPPALGRAGTIHIVDTATGRDADTIDVSSPVALKTIGGEPNYRYYPVIISGTEATIYPKNGALSYNHTYVVTIDAGAFRVDDQDCAALGRDAGWTFTTRAAPPAAGATQLTVAGDGTGDFCTVQGAIDFVPEGNTTPVTISVRKGTYTELIFFTNKHAITIAGEDRATTVIAYATNDRFNPSSGNPFGTPKPDPSAARRGGNIYHRGVFLAHRVNDLVLTNLTIRNTTPQGGSQAEAIILNGTTTARAILKDVDLYSYQDTLQINGQAFLTGCYIEGDVDFMWGTGPCFFEHCTCRTLRSGAYYTQIRNPGTNHGYVYVDCTFDGATGIMGNYLSRIGTSRFPHSEVVLIDCTLTPAVGPVAWQFQGGREGNENEAADVHFWEFNSHDPAGKPVHTQFRLKGSRQLSQPADAETIAHYRDPAYVLGGWNPRAAPVFHAAHHPASTPEPGAPRIDVQPASQLALLGTPATFAVAATSPSRGSLTYQWNRNGHPLPGATNSALRIRRVAWNDAAAYTVTVRDGTHAVTTSTALLTAVAPQANPAPDLPRIPDAVFDVTAFGAVADGATDNTVSIQKAIDAALAAGGGVVVVPAGPKPYLSGPLTLGSNLNLEIAAGATVQLLPYSAEATAGSYPLRGNAYPNFLTASKAHDLAITGAGTIDGDGAAWWAAYAANRKMPHRPYLVRLNGCERVLVSGVTFTRSPMFHVAVSADHLTVVGVTVRTPDGTPNTDGIDPAGSHHLIQNCAVSCGDDNIVMKPGGTFCSDITIADCAFGEGHGMSVGGQTNRGLDGMVVKNCSFEGTVSGLRLKADATQGGEVRNLTYTNLTMDGVRYPIVFYSYYNQVGNPGSTSGKNKSGPDKAAAWNAQPPNPLDSATLPSWKNITLQNIVARAAGGFSIMWGLPLKDRLVEGVKLNNVRIVGGAGFALYNATDVHVMGNSELGEIIPANAVVISREPQRQTVAPGATATFTVATPAPTAGAAVNYQWTFNGEPLAEGRRDDGTSVAGTHSASLTLSGVTPAAAGKYAVVVSASLDGYDPAKHTLVAGAIPVSFTSTPAPLTVAASGAP